MSLNSVLQDPFERTVLSVLFCRTRLKELVCVNPVLQSPFVKASLRHSILSCRTSPKELVCVTGSCSAGPV